MVTVILLLQAASALAADSKRLLSYYPFWAKYQTPPYTAAQIPFSKMTHISHAFLLLNGDGDGRLFVDPGLLEPELISKAHAAGVKVMISIGGADPVQAAAFHKIAAGETTRRQLAQNVRRFVANYGYDGVDIDWEVPNAPDDTLPCILLMQALRDELPAPRWLISMAIPSDPRGYGTGFDVPSLTPLVDFINVMTYDFHGPWSDHAGHNSPLVLNKADPGLEGGLVTSINLFEKIYGVPREKLNIGTAFYGYEFDGVQDLWQYCDCGPNTTSQNYGTYIKPRINQMGWKTYIDNIAKAPYLLHQTRQPGFITYDDAVSTSRKADYVLGRRKLGGIFMWDLSADYDGKTQDLLDAMYRAFLRQQ